MIPMTGIICGWIAVSARSAAEATATGRQAGASAERSRQHAAAELVGGEPEGDGAGDAGQMIGGDQRPMTQRRQVAEQQVEGEEEDAAVGLAGVGVVPEA